MDEFIAESAIMLDFDHPNVLHLVGVCFDTEDQLPLIVLPYMANGDLKSFLKKKRQQSANNLPEVGRHTHTTLYILEHPPIVPTFVR